MRQVVIPLSLARVPVLAPAGECLNLSGESMGTTWQVRVVAPVASTASLNATIVETLALVVRQMSHWEPASDLSRFNREAAGSAPSLPEPLFDLLRRAQEISSQTGGAFDVTAGALAQCWGFGPDRGHRDPAFRIPDAAQVAHALSLGGWQRLTLDRSRREACQPGGLQLDLSAIAKGFAVDLLSRRLMDEGFTSHLVEIGGELRGAGLKADAQPWWVALEPPEADSALDEVVIALCDRAIATTGDYRRSFVREGRRYPHTLDPRTGQTVDNNLASVTVIGDECWQADALSTALTVMGEDEGCRFADRHGIAARFLRRTESGFRESRSRAWSDMLL